MTQKNILRGVATAVAVAALAVAGVAASSGSNSNSSTATAAPGARSGAPPAGAPNFGSPATGVAAAKAKAAALAKYPGQVERIFKTPSGGYVVHIFKSDGSEVHVLVSSTFQVTGTQAGPRGGRPAGAPPRPSTSTT